jgi:benzoyl-CoA reductase/2-hydroxyglutaryl-CoA dehydratase subunit BcrC/BadD/HgdB
LVALKERLEALTGQKIDDERLRGSIKLYNNMRSSFRKISDLRKKSLSPVEGSDFVRLNHASYYASPELMVKVLDSCYEEMRGRNGGSQVPEKRILLAGPNLAMGDSKVISLVENLGGGIVVEDICEGIRFYWENVSPEGDLLESIAHRYLTKRIPCAFQGQGTKERYTFLEKLAREYNINGLIWYELRYCETYNLEYHYVQQHFKEAGIPTLKIESDYDPADIGQLHTRVESFLKIMER